MYITCTKCRTRFIVSNEHIGVQGRQVKCSKCHHIWYQKLNFNTTTLTEFDKTSKTQEPVTAPPRNEYTTAGVNLPALLPNTSNKYHIFPWLWCCLITFCILMILLDDNLLFKYNQLHIENIIIKNIDNNNIKTSYQVTNLSHDKISNLLIRIRLIDESHKILAEYITLDTDINIRPKQTLIISIELPKLTPQTKYLDITMGNKLDFLIN